MLRPRLDAVLAHFDPDGEVAPHVRLIVERLAAAADRLIFVSTAPLTGESRSWLNDRAQLIVRDNVGHDFASYRAGLAALGGEIADVLLINDSAVFVGDMDTVISRMSARRMDFWGITPGYGFAPHLQSYFMVFSRRVIQSDAWLQFWREGDDRASRGAAILDGEVRLSQTLLAAGFTMDALFKPSFGERVRGAARAHSEELTRAVRHGHPRAVVGWVKRLHARAIHPEWNLAVALADIAIRAPDRLPAVKISTVRDDAYHLGAVSLLAALERHYPEELCGVAEYLGRVDAIYGRRWAQTRSESAGIFRYRSR